MCLSPQVTDIVQKKVDNKPKVNKYKLYVDELDKVMYLLLKLSGRLARAENAVRSLPEDASQQERVRNVTAVSLCGNSVLAVFASLMDLPYITKAQTVSVLSGILGLKA